MKNTWRGIESCPFPEYMNGVWNVKGKTRVSESIDDETFGMLFFADVFSFEEIHSEIEKILITDNLVENWTYPLIQPKLIEEAKNRGYL